MGIYNIYILVIKGDRGFFRGMSFLAFARHTIQRLENAQIERRDIRIQSVFSNLDRGAYRVRPAMTLPTVIFFGLIF